LGGRLGRSGLERGFAGAAQGQRGQDGAQQLQQQDGGQGRGRDGLGLLGRGLGNCEVISSATADIGAMAHDTQTAWRQLAPLLMLPRPTPTALASRRATTRASTARATAPLHEAWAATVETSTNISRVSSDEAVPSWRGQAQGRWCSCLSSMPPSSAAITDCP